MRRPISGHELLYSLQPLTSIPVRCRYRQAEPIYVWTQSRFQSSKTNEQKQSKSKATTNRTPRHKRNVSSNASAKGMWSSLQRKLSKQRRLKATRVASAPKEPRPEPKPGRQPLLGKIPGVRANDTSATKNTIQPTKIKATHIPLPKETRVKIPALSYGLKRVLFNPGVYDLRDQRSGVFNFDPFLSQLVPNDKFDFDALGEFRISSKDPKLQSMAKEHRKKYFSSTSSITSLLSQLHYLLSGWRTPNYGMLSRDFRVESHNFTTHTRAPAAAFLRHRDGAYAIDADKTFDRENVLRLMGQSMEKLLTLPKEEYEKYTKQKSHQLTEEERKKSQDVHAYMRVKDFLLRSQLDAQDRRLPGSGVFDVKTRAVVSIRMDVHHYEKGQGYEIWNRQGQWESFEREYYDMIRAAFLKYSLQARIGGMDGIFVAYHNTKRLFGFQYIGLEEMDYAIHGTTNKALGDGEFKASMAILNDLLDRATKRFPNKTLHFHMECRPTQTPLLYFYAEPIEEEEVDRLQEQQLQQAHQIRDEILESTKESLGADVDEPSVGAAGIDLWEALSVRASQTLEDRNGMDSIREAIRTEINRTRRIALKTDLESEADLDMLVEALSSDVSLSTSVPAAPNRLQTAKQPDSPEVEMGEVAEGTEVVEKADPTDSGMAHASKAEEPDITKDIEEVEEPLGEDSVVSDLDIQSGEAADSPVSKYKGFPLKALIKLVAESAISNVDSCKKSPRAFERALVECFQDSQDSQDSSEATSPDSKGEPRGSATPGQEPEKASQEKEPEFLGLYVNTEHKVNGQWVARPSAQYDPSREWDVRYTIGEVPKAYGARILRDLKLRRKKVFEDSISKSAMQWRRMFQGRLHKYSAEGAKKREEVSSKDKARGKIFVAWDGKARSTKVMENDLA